MKRGFTLQDLFPSYDGNDGDWAQHNYLRARTVISIFSILISLAGLEGNGNVIWLLGFRVKRKPFATYILNFAVADLECLVLGLGLNIRNILLNVYKYHGINFIIYRILTFLFMLMYSISEFLLTAIGIERCVSAFFPNWYQCHRSPGLSTRVCVLMWALSFVLQGVPIIIEVTFHSIAALLWVNIVSPLVCLSLVTICALILLIKVCFKAQPCHCGNLWKVVLLMLPSNLFWAILTYPYLLVQTFFFFGLPFYLLWASLKSSINPLIYFLAGRQKGGKFQERMKVILQRVFKEERDTRTELQPRMETPL